MKYLTGSFGRSIRRACRLVGMQRSSYSYKKILKPDEDAIRNKLKELAEAKPKYGYRMLHILLRRKGYMINHKRTERLYAEEKFRVPELPPQRDGGRVPAYRQAGLSPSQTMLCP